MIDSMRKAERQKELGKSKGPKVGRRTARTQRLTIGIAAFEKVSAIEGLHLTREMKRTFSALDRQRASAAQRRAAIKKKYG
jgi:hypothetical protein